MSRLLVALVLAASVAGSTASAAQVTLVLNPRAIDGTTFTLGATYQARGGGFYRPELLRYYIAGITLHHDGTSTQLQDKYVLVDISKTDRYDLGDVAMQRLDSITFHLGVDIAHNHLDPAKYPDWHPLAYQEPSMHWGWESGYRFVTYEGRSGTRADNLTAPMQIHTVDDALYTRVSLRAGATRTAQGIDIPLLANYEYLLESIDVSRGLVNHSAEGEAITLMRNMSQRVYSASVISSVNDAAPAPQVAPNPASDIVSVPQDVIEASIVDVAGNVVASSSFANGSNIIAVQHLAQGAYGLVMHHVDGRMTHATLAIAR